MVTKKDTKDTKDEGDKRVASLEERISRLERVVLGGALPEGIDGLHAPSAERANV